MNAEWKKIENSNYSISSDGQVRNDRTNKVIKPFRVGRSGNKYLAVDLRPRKNVKVHQLVAAHFLGDSVLQVNHKNGNKEDNTVDNLEYCTAKENVQHAWKIKLAKPKLGNSNGISKIPKDVAYEIKYNSPDKSHRQWAEELGVSQNAINLIRKGKNWSWL